VHWRLSFWATTGSKLAHSSQNSDHRQRAKLSARNDIAKAIQYGLRQWNTLARFSAMAACA
jgi:hypothetical protein